jgi:hypothetical protein
MHPEASAGARKTSDTGVFSFICRYGFVKLNFISDFSGKVRMLNNSSE